jgi:hypothetical protein
MDGYLTTQLLYVAAVLGVTDVLAERPRTGREVAQAVGADPDVLTRILRGLVVEDVLREDGDRFALTETGACLRDGAPGSLRGQVVARGEVYWPVAAGLLQTAREGGISFEHVHGESFFSHLAAHDGHRAAFDASMAGRAQREAADVVAAYDFMGVARLVDVGGGEGVLMATILGASPRTRGVLVDRPDAVAAARRRLADAGERCECRVGDFFVAVPKGGDAYLLSRVIHDWHDDEAQRILATCRVAMHAGARLLLVEAIVPERAGESPEAIRMDLHMLMLLGGRERTEREYRELLGAAGFALQRVVPTASPTGLCVLEATASPTIGIGDAVDHH